MSLKQKVHKHCEQILNKKIEVLISALNNAVEAANNETKSTAGDKHETGRAMMQLEQEKLGHQLKEMFDQRTELEKIDPAKTAHQITKGSFVETDKSFLYLGIGLGKIVVEGKTIFAISSQSPLGQKLLGKKENDRVEVNGTQYIIQKIG